MLCNRFPSVFEMSSMKFILLIVVSIVFVYGHPSPSEEKQPSARNANCRSWYDKQGDPKELLAKTLNPPCQIPATFPSTLIDGWKTDSGCDASKQPNTCDLHQGAYGCYRHSVASTGPGAQACYDQQGQWISDPWKGAGTLDAETPSNLIQNLLHFTADVLPYYDCCTSEGSPQPETCNLYYEKRPPGQCEDKPAL